MERGERPTAGAIGDEGRSIASTVAGSASYSYPSPRREADPSRPSRRYLMALGIRYTAKEAVFRYVILQDLAPLA